MVQKQVAYYLLIMASPVIGAFVLGVTLSWNSLPFVPYPIMKYILGVGTLVFQLIFIYLTLTIQERNTLNVFIDLSVGVVSLFVDWYWLYKNKWGEFNSVDLNCYGIIVGFMFMRLWYSATNPDTNPIQRSNERRLLVTLDKLHLVWITRSTADVFELYPEILALWDDLIESWGTENARKMCQISIYCTDKNREHQEGLMDEYKDSSLFKEGVLKFGRPQLDKVVEKESEENMMTRSASHTLVVFCGGQSMAKRVKEAKILNDITLNITGNAAHEVDLVIESYGGETKRAAPKTTEKTKDINTASSDNKNPTKKRLDPLKGSTRVAKVHAKKPDTYVNGSNRSLTSNPRDLRVFTRRASSNLSLTQGQFLDLTSEIDGAKNGEKTEKMIPGYPDSNNTDKGRKAAKVSFIEHVQQPDEAPLKVSDNKEDEKVVDKKEVAEGNEDKVSDVEDEEIEREEGDLRLSLIYES